MSKWTHVLGIIRFEDFERNCWPKPRVDKSKEHADLIHDIFQRYSIPEGSEGPLDLQTIITDRGPTVILTGDLRDFDRSNVDEICKYLNEVINNIKEDTKLKGKGKITLSTMYVRDAMIDCNVEYYDKRVMLIYDFEKYEFKVIELPFFEEDSSKKKSKRKVKEK